MPAPLGQHAVFMGFSDPRWRTDPTIMRQGFSIYVEDAAKRGGPLILHDVNHFAGNQFIAPGTVFVQQCEEMSPVQRTELSAIASNAHSRGIQLRCYTGCLFVNADKTQTRLATAHEIAMSAVALRDNLGCGVVYGDGWAGMMTDDNWKKYGLRQEDIGKDVDKLYRDAQKICVPYGVRLGAEANFLDPDGPDMRSAYNSVPQYVEASWLLNREAAGYTFPRAQVKWINDIYVGLNAGTAEDWKRWQAAGFGLAATGPEQILP